MGTQLKRVESTVAKPSFPAEISGDPGGSQSWRPGLYYPAEKHNPQCRVFTTTLNRGGYIRWLVLLSLFSSRPLHIITPTLELWCKSDSNCGVSSRRAPIWHRRSGSLETERLTDFRKNGKAVSHLELHVYHLSQLWKKKAWKGHNASLIESFA